MKMNVKALKTLLKAKRITVDSVKELVKSGLLTADQYAEITGEAYPA